MKQVSIPARNIFVAFALSAACTMPALAQSTTGTDTAAGGSTTGVTSTQTAPDTTNREEDRDYGWVGLLVLVGLLGLRRKHEDHTVTRTTAGTTR